MIENVNCLYLSKRTFQSSPYPPSSPLTQINNIVIIYKYILLMSHNNTISTWLFILLRYHVQYIFYVFLHIPHRLLLLLLLVHLPCAWPPLLGTSSSSLLHLFSFRLRLSSFPFYTHVIQVYHSPFWFFVLLLLSFALLSSCNLISYVNQCKSIELCGSKSESRKARFEKRDSKSESRKAREGVLFRILQRSFVLISHYEALKIKNKLNNNKRKTKREEEEHIQKYNTIN